MKTRLGFVSNSSSTSYTVLTTVENHEKALASLNEIDQGIIGLLKKAFEKKKVFGLDLIAFSLITGEYGSLDWMLKDSLPKFVKKHPEVGEDEWDYVYYAIEAYKKAVSKDKDNIWVHIDRF